MRRITSVETLLVIALILSVFSISYFAYDSAIDSQRNSEKVSRLEDEVRNLTLQLNQSQDLNKNQNTTPIRIKIGYIASSQHELTNTQQYINKVVAPDLSDYLRNTSKNVTFQFIIKADEGTPGSHLQQVKALKELGADLIIDGGTSDQVKTTLDYINTNNMLTISTNSSDPTLSIPGDRLFRLCPPDSDVAPAIVEAMWSYGINDVVIIQRDDPRSESVTRLFKSVLMDRESRTGALGSVIQVVKFPVGATNFTDVLERANQYAAQAVSRQGDSERVGILLLINDELYSFTQQVRVYTSLYNCPFFGSYDTAHNMKVYHGDTVEAINHIRLFSVTPGLVWDSRTFNVDERNWDTLHQMLRPQDAFLYDSSFIIVGAVLRCGSVNASKVCSILPFVCSSTSGLSGPCLVDSYGDRTMISYDIVGWGLASVGETGEPKPTWNFPAGVCISTYFVRHCVIWDAEMMKWMCGYTPLGGGTRMNARTPYIL